MNSYFVALIGTTLLEMHKPGTDWTIVLVTVLK